MFIRCIMLVSLISLLACSPGHADDPAVLPNHELTPGQWNDPPTPLVKLCTRGDSTLRRKVSGAMKAEVFRRYGMDPEVVIRRHWEIDHLVPLTLDGTNSYQNLWPQSYMTKGDNADQKNTLARVLRRKVCSREIDLLTAQEAISTDWIAAYRKYVVRH